MISHHSGPDAVRDLGLPEEPAAAAAGPLGAPATREHNAKEHKERPHKKAGAKHEDGANE